MLMTTMLAKMPDLRRQVLTDHAADDHGYCRDCRVAQWPCEVYEIAASAEPRNAAA